MASLPGTSTGPLGYGGLDPKVNPPYVQANRIPTTNDQLDPGTQWQDNSVTPHLVYITTGGGVWSLLGSFVGTLDTLTGDSGGPISPTSNNINLLGADGIVTTGSGSTITFSLEGGSEAIDSFVPDAGTNPVVPTALGAVTMAGTANQITTTGGLNTLTFSVSSTFVAPGTLTVTGLSTLAVLTQVGTANINASGAAVTTIGTGGTGAVAIGNATGNTAITGGATISTTLGVTGLSTLAALTQVGTANINASGAGVTTIGTGGTGAVAIGNATGNTAVTGSLTASTGLVATTGGITATGTSNINTTGAAVTSIGTGGTGATNIGNATGNTAVTGSLTASTTLTATLGAITATNGNLVMGTAGNKVLIPATTTTSAGAYAAGSVALVLGSAIVATSAVTANSIILLTCQVLGTIPTPAAVGVTARTPGVSFTITSNGGTDTSTIGWIIYN